ncbi:MULTISPECIES: hypothetical protein [unclassified Raoultella]|uniref:hypothetical protein n=1 Tax=unclassified Raoultella TaxID=2627600 RepID=UPI00135BF05E|nr:MULTISPECIES: hypothetical protein [unclassified Raoultella]
MIIKIFILFVFGLLMFVIGFFVGGMRWDWASKDYSSLVAFWSMIGGWVSGVATLSAVLVSLILARQAMEKELEKISVKVLSFKKDTIGDSYRARVNVMNMNNNYAKVKGVSLFLDKITPGIRVNHILDAGIFPKVLNRKGECINFSISFDSGNNWWHIFERLSQDENLKFKECKIAIQTEIGLHYCKLEPVILKKMKYYYDKYEERKRI